MARILLCSYSGYGAWFTLRLQEEGHKVDYYLTGNKYNKVLQDIVPIPLSKTPDFRKYDVILFDLTGNQKLAESAYSVNDKVIGDGDFQAQLEDDREFALQVMEEVGINVPFYETFDNINDAKKFIKKTRKRYVFKPNGGQGQDTACTYVSEGPDDLLDYLNKLGSMAGGATFVLQEFIEGIEVSTEGYFNGTDFYLINGTLEEKKFMNEGRGPNTGCSGNLVWTYSPSIVDGPYVFREGLGKMKDFLQEYKFRGPIDLNTIVTTNKLYGLEWTPRFGYDASPTLFALVTSNLGDFFHAIASGEISEVITGLPFAASVRLSIPPYPTEMNGKHPHGVPINGLDYDSVVCDCYLYDAMLEKDALITAGINGLVACPIGMGDSIEQAFTVVYNKIKGIKIPDMQYRTDLMQCCLTRYKFLHSWGWLR